jgi:hypothetical protein
MKPGPVRPLEREVAETLVAQGGATGNGEEPGSISSSLSPQGIHSDQQCRPQ